MVPATMSNGRFPGRAHGATPSLTATTRLGSVPGTGVPGDQQSATAAMKIAGQFENAVRRDKLISSPDIPDLPARGR